MVDKIKEELSLSAELIKSGGGVYEIAVNGELIFSKKRTGIFPDDDDIIAKLKDLQ